MTRAIGEPPVCIYCRRGTTPARLVKVWFKYSTRQRFYACGRCAARYDRDKQIPPEPLVNRRRSIPSLAERLAEWNALDQELKRLFAQYRSEPRVAATMKAACSVWNSVCWRATDMTWALVDLRSDRPDEAGDQVRVLRWHVDRFGPALERAPSLKGRRALSDLEAPDLRLADTLAAVREAYAREHGLMEATP
jgi:hypothetical protein